MEIKLQIDDDYCQGNAHALCPVEDEEFELPVEDRRIKSIRLKGASK